MTKFMMLNEISREVIATSAANAEKRFRNAVHPIYGATNQGRPEHIGSCVTIRVGGVHYLLTAAHIIDENRYTSLYIGKGSLHQLAMDFSVTNAPKDNRKFDHYDFAFGVLKPEDLDALKTADFLDKNDFDLNHDSHAYTLLGYPNSKNKKVNHTQKTVSPQLYKYTGTQKNPATLINKLGLSEADHLYIAHGKYSMDTEGKKVQSVKIRGMSGGAVIGLGPIATIQTLSGDFTPTPKLSGITVEHYNNEKIILATHIAPILESMSPNYGLQKV